MAKTIFYIAYLFLFCIGGFLAFVGVPFRMAYVSLLVIMLIPLYGMPFDRITKLFLVLVMVIIASGIVNRSSIRETLLFLRFVITPFAMYYLVKIFLSPHNIKKIINISITLGMIQLPVVIFQRLSYNWLIGYSAFPGGISHIDFNFGTFYVKCDPAMSFFLMGLILFLLFDNKHNYFVRHRIFKAIWFSLAIMVANSIICHLMLMGIWAYYFLSGLSIKTLVQAGLVVVVAVGLFSYFSWTELWTELAGKAVSKITFQNVGNLDRFLEGGYSRTAAVLYYLNEPLKLLGDGPSRYYDPLTRTRLLGNTGHVLTFYGELGLIGLFVSYWIMYRIAKRKRGNSPEMARLYFLVAVLLTATTSVMSDASIMLSYNLFLSTDMIRKMSIFPEGGKGGRVKY